MAKTLEKNPKNTPKVILAVLFVLVFSLGWLFGHQDTSRFGYTPTINNKNSQNQNVDFGDFWRAWQQLESKFDGKIDYQNMVYGAIKGLTSSLGDPYTAFMTPKEAKQLEDDLSGKLSGIGAEVGIKSGKVTIISPIDDSPAKKAGIMSGDVISSIDGTSTEGMDINTAVSKIRGEAGTVVKLVVIRNGAEKKFDITRAEINVKSVKSEIKDGNVGYVQLTRFDEQSDSELADALQGFTQKGVKKVILDLRDDPGGYLDQAVKVSSEFIKSGVVVSERKDSANGGKTEYRASGNGLAIDPEIELVVLINSGSASASEIVAGALKDHKRATLVGEKSFGKGSVQEVIDLSKGAKMRITVAHWYTPSGKNISKEGIAPDVEVKLTDADYNANRDPQLDKAIELLNR